MGDVEIFAEGSFTEGTLTWGWQCFRCREEETGFGSATTAGDGRDNHQCPSPCRCIAAGRGGVHYPSDHASVTPPAETSAP